MAVPIFAQELTPSPESSNIAAVACARALAACARARDDGMSDAAAQMRPLALREGVPAAMSAGAPRRTVVTAAARV